LAAQVADLGRLERALAAIDDANRDDPNTLAVRGETRPKELAHAELASEWVQRLRPDASEALRLAARGHHVRRWEIPRGEYPMDRAGYHRWRKALHAHHVHALTGILERCGYDAETIARAGALVRKQGLGRDPEVQALEDALCLVFVETQLALLAGRMETDKLIDVTRKTLRKMSPEAIEHATRLPLDEASRALLLRAASDEAVE
jgi:hypothetical protein